MTEEANCVYCQREQDQVPLLTMRVAGRDAWICPEHLPILIHKPHLLKGKLEGTENLNPEDH